MTALAMQQTGIKPATKIVLYWLADHHNSETGLCCPSLKKLAAECEMTKSTVCLHLKALEDGGFIEVNERFRANGSQTSSEYLLNLTPVRKTTPPLSEKPGGALSEKAPPLNLGSNNLGNEPTPIAPKGDLLGDLPEASKQDAEGDHFAEFWKAYPTGPRKTDKPKAKLAFNAIVAGKRKGIDKMDPAVIVAAVKRYEASNPDPQYVPLPTTWLNGARWDQFPEQVERRRGGQSIPYFGEITR